MGLLDKFFKKDSAASAKRIDVEARFERIRSAISGTMSNFFVAKDRQNGDQIVGVKLCDIDKVEFFESRFKGLNKPSEGQISSQMSHPNIAKTLEYGFTTKGQPYIVMEFVDGPGLQVLLLEKMEEPLRGNRLSLMIQMAEALKYVHDKEFIHRDICPRNYICTQDIKTIKLIDFGLTLPATRPFMQPGNRTGTPLYMAPEIVRRRSTDKRVDVFSFGVTCYQMITFELPWNTQDTSGKAALQHDTAPPIDILEFRPDLDKVLANAVMSAIKANADQRTPDMDTMLRQFRQVKSSP
jgi:serine/threonine protein kinase